MAIEVRGQDLVFHLYTKNTSYLLNAAEGKYLAHVYWGRRIRIPALDNALLLRWSCFDVMEPVENPFSLDYICREYPTVAGDYRIPAIEMEYADGSRECSLDFCGYRVIEEKPGREGMPSLYTEPGDACETLEITLRDSIKRIEVLIYYTVYEDYDVITRSVTVKNSGAEEVYLTRVASASVDFENSEFELLTLPGAWGRERHIERYPLRRGRQTAGSSRGASSHQMNPFVALLEPGTTEEKGNVYSMNLVYSGNFTMGAEVDQIGKTRLFMGLGNEDFSWLLEAGESFDAPECVMVFSSRGLGGMSGIYHNIYRERLLRGTFQVGKRPILVNNWEATYFDFNEDKIVSLAKAAAGLGIELLVLDDGWFGRRNSDTCSLGDWYANPEKLPDGIAGLAEKVKEQGIQFGLWVEPEMVSPDSDLYRKHPDWCIHVKGRPRSECRNQLTLDLSREDVCNYLIQTLRELLSSAPISYIKWDMNRHMSNVGSAKLPANRQRELPHRYILGLYRVLQEVTEAFPDVLFESCSGGGGRFDPGMLYYMPQTWTSDDTDPVERIYIQYGTSLVYPISTMGAHVSAVPNHQSGRVTPLKMRGDVAMSGNLGYELDLTKFTEEEKECVRGQAADYKKLRNLILQGDFYRLKSPFEGTDAAWMVIAKGKEEFFAAYFQMQARVNPGISRIKFRGLNPDADYEDEATGKIYGGDELMQIGLVVDCFGDYQSRTWFFREKESDKRGNKK